MKIKLIIDLSMKFLNCHFELLSVLRKVSKDQYKDIEMSEDECLNNNPRRATVNVLASVNEGEKQKQLK